MARAVRVQSGLSGRVDWTFVLAVAGLIARARSRCCRPQHDEPLLLILQKHFIA